MKHITVIDYLIERIAELGVSEFFGLPGDYNFNVLDAIERNKDTKWIGCCNELNAAYAADGYARVKGIGAVVTTFGVGELSAVNAIAGSFAENLPVIMIAGTPEMVKHKNQEMLHHTLGDGDYNVFQNIFDHVTAATAKLTVENAVEEIDRLLHIAIETKKPVYFSIAKDVCLQYIVVGSKPLDRRKSDPESLNAAAEAILNELNKAKRPAIISDTLVIRNKAEKLLEKLVKKGGFPVATMYMGKGSIDETMPNYIGQYSGNLINEETRNIIENSDYVLAVGLLRADLNTGLFTTKLKELYGTDVQDYYVAINEVRYNKVLFTDLLEKLVEKVVYREGLIPDIDVSLKYEDTKMDNPLNHKYMYARIQDMLKPNDLVVAETGTIGFGTSQVRMSSGCSFYNQTLWGSIGWATPAAFGIGIAAPDRRLIFLTGDGSHQLTAQELSSMFRFGLKPIIIVLDNSGYTIERLLCNDPMDEYNEIPAWNYALLPKAFGGKAFVAEARTNGEFDKALKQAELEQPNQLCYIVAHTDKMDAPPLVQAMHQMVFKKV